LTLAEAASELIRRNRLAGRVLAAGGRNVCQPKGLASPNPERRSEENIVLCARDFLPRNQPEIARKLSRAAALWFPVSVSEPPSKTELRRAMRARLIDLPPGVRKAASAEVCRRLEGEEFWRRARSVLLVAPRSDEIDLWPLVATALAGHKRVFLPAYEPASGAYQAREIRDPVADLTVGPFGILEPKPGCPGVTAMPLDLVVVPGLAFDPRGWRLGRGKGFYDRMLESVSAVTCGVAFDEQIVPAVPVEPHDVQLSFVLTPAHRIVGRPALA
jgi:5-formyltetrahydrofolate cyclo-ligase